jgi:hypothetical protein
VTLRPQKLLLTVSARPFDGGLASRTAVSVPLAGVGERSARRIRHGARAVLENLGERAHHAIFERQDPDRAGGRQEFNRQDLERQLLAEADHRARKQGDKTSRRDQLVVQREGKRGDARGAPGWKNCLEDVLAGLLSNGARNTK